MDNFDAETFGQLNAADYDDVHNPGTTQQTVDMIAALAEGSRILELAIGTGRVALPLAKRGLDITGIEASPLMVDKMRIKPGGADIPVVIGDMGKVSAEGPFDFAYLVFNTLFNLTSQAAQAQCFANTAKALRPGGQFLVEAFVPRFDHFAEDQQVKTKQLDSDGVWLEAVTHDRMQQHLSFQRIRVTSDGMKLVPLLLRYSYPPEIDLMAQLAGLTLKHRWGGWDKSTFTKDSGMHVSVYEKPA